MRIEYYLVAVALVFPLVCYVWAAMRTPRSKVSTLASYFIAYRQVGTAPFANSSLAYAFQVATLFPFLYWGVQGQILPAVVNAVFWGIGIFLFRRCLPSITECLGQSSTPKTLHGLLGQAHSSKAVHRVAAGVTILGMIGVALAEAYWGMQILKVLVPEDTAAYYAIVLGALLFVLAYIWYGGTWGSMKTDMLQLVFSYLGFTFVFVFAIVTVVRGNSHFPPAFPIVSALMCAGGVAAITIRLRNGIRPVSPMDDANDKFWLKLGLGLSIATLVAMALLVLSFGWLFARSLPDGTLTPLISPGDPKWRGLAALAVMATFFQFVDMSAWQRLQSIRGTQADAQNGARRGLLLFTFESPFSWIMCVALGCLIMATVPQVASVDDKAGPLAAYPRLLMESGGGLHVTVAFMFMVGVMGVMLSTIDSALLAAMYAYTADVLGFEFQDGAEDSEAAAKAGRQNLLSGKKAAFGFTVCISAGVIALGWLLKSPDRLISMLVGFYGAMLSLFPAVVLMLKKSRRLSGLGLAIGIIAGVVTAIGLTVWGIFDPDRSWDAVFAAPLIAIIVPLVLHVLGVRRTAQ